MKLLQRQRGSVMLGMSAVILISGAFCATVLVRSMESYRETARLEQTLQMLAAAEGAAAVAGEAIHAQPVPVGQCQVKFDVTTSASQQMLVELTRTNGTVIASRRFERIPENPASVRLLP